MTKLYPFQKRNVKEIIKRFQGRALIADEMGLGKTAQAYSVLGFYQEWPALIIVPASLRLNWLREAKKFLPKNTICDADICIVKTGKDPIYGNLIITSYELATSRYLEFGMYGVRMIVLDESHCIKNPKAKRTQNISAICLSADRCLLLTGTPVLNRPKELYTQLKVLKAPVGEFWDFAKKYCNAHKKRIGWNKVLNKPKMVWDFDGASNLDELKYKLTLYCMVRNLKSEVLKDLPEKTRSIVAIENAKTTSEKEMCEIAELCACDAVGSGKGVREAKKLYKERVDHKESKKMLFNAYHDIGIEKAKVAAQIAVDNDGGSPLVIFAHHREALNTIEKELDKNFIELRRIDGSTPTEKRQQYIDDFQSGLVNVMLLSINAASTGITLTRANDMLIVELPFSPGIAMQAEDRIHRIGQDRGVLIRYLISGSFVDQSIWEMLNEKKQIQNAIHSGEDLKIENTEKLNNSVHEATIDFLINTYWRKYNDGRNKTEKKIKRQWHEETSSSLSAPFDCNEEG